MKFECEASCCGFLAGADIAWLPVVSRDFTSAPDSNFLPFDLVRQFHGNTCLARFSKVAHRDPGFAGGRMNPLLFPWRKSCRNVPRSRKQIKPAWPACLAKQAATPPTSCATYCRTELTTLTIR